MLTNTRYDSQEVDWTVRLSVRLEAEDPATSMSHVAHLTATLKLIWFFLDLQRMAAEDQSLPVSAALDPTRKEAVPFVTVHLLDAMSLTALLIPVFGVIKQH